MITIRSLVQTSLVAACVAISFVSVQVYMSAKAEVAPTAAVAPRAVLKAVPIAEYGDVTKPMSPIYATTKYTQAQLAVPAAKKPAKAKLAVAAVNKMPMQLAYVPDQQIATRANVIFSHIR